ncbi:MAG: hypothetical protein H6551_05650 [Chitinophagales bacterium]|nr:hypothetical protein [Chitinophagaceae bacterium]MCB9064615.1 hypothetical protein [Chitinophagales bacterium]
MTTRFYTLIAFIIAAISFQSCDEELIPKQSNKPVPIRFNLSTDSAYQYTIQNNIFVEQQIDAENTVTMEQNMTLTAGYMLLDSSDKKRDITVSYDKISMSTGNQLYALEFDSETDDGADPMYEDLRRLIGQNFKMSLSPNGDILYSEPITAVNQSSLNAFKVKDSSIRKILVNTFCFYPNLDVMVGDNWQNTFETSIGFANVKVRCAYQLASVKKNIAHIELQGKLSSAHAEQAGGSNIDMRGTLSGFYDVDIKSGMVVTARIKQELAGEIDITGKLTPAKMESSISIMGVKKQMVPK